MRKYFQVLCLLLLSLGCDKVDELTKFDMDYDTQVVIESTTNISLPFVVSTPEMETNSESEFAVNDTRKDLIEEIKLKSLELQIADPASEDFSFLESVEIFIDADGLEEVSIASVIEVSDETGSVLELETSDADIQEYIKKERFNLRLKTKTDEILTEDLKIDVRSVFFVDAKILGI